MDYLTYSNYGRSKEEQSINISNDYLVIMMLIVK
jgi:hypothetical protein